MSDLFEPRPPAEEQPQYDPVQPDSGRKGFRQKLGRLTAPLVGVGALLLKLGSLFKFATIFIAVGGYALIFGWPFAVGFVALIFVHELGHFIEAQREGLHPKVPVFIPFIGAYVKMTAGNPWQAARVALAGPIVGGFGAMVCYIWGEHQHSPVLHALAYTGFMLNLINMIPVSILDGGAVFRAARFLWHGGGRNKALAIYGLYALTAVALILGMRAAYIVQHRL